MIDPHALPRPDLAGRQFETTINRGQDYIVRFDDYGYPRQVLCHVWRANGTHFWRKAWEADDDMTTTARIAYKAVLRANPVTLEVTHA